MYMLATALNDFLEPIRERRAHYEQHMDLVEDAIMLGVKKGRKPGSFVSETYP